MVKWLRLVFLGLIVFGFFGYLFTHYATEKSVADSLNKHSQNVEHYLPAPYTLKPSEQQIFTAAYLRHYLSPWQNALSSEQTLELKRQLISELNALTDKPRVGANKEYYPASWVKHLAVNIHLSDFPNENRNAIIIHDGYIRILPTIEPAYFQFNSLSQGYPFDSLQQSFIAAGSPVRIVHTTQDKSWHYVIANSFSGWIRSNDVAFVSESFIQSWKNGHYAMSLHDNISLLSGNTMIPSHIGVLYPIQESSKETLVLKVVSADSSGNAQILLATVPTKEFTLFPMPLNSQNVCHVAKQFIGKPYGWGGIYGYRDCSSTTQDLMALFGIWLPRNSSAQIYSGEPIALSGLSQSAKKKLITSKGIPWLTLIHLPGHVVMYIGEHNGRIMVLENKWGVHIHEWISGRDRIVIGKTVISPLDFGKEFMNVNLNALSAADYMTVLVPRNALH